MEHCLDFESCITYEKGDLIDVVSLYDKNKCCCGDINTEKNIYEVANPYFLSDTFIFCKMHTDDVPLIDKNDSIYYIKINHNHQIEEIGSHFDLRFGFNDYNEFLKRKDIKFAKPINKIIFTMIGKEFWSRLNSM